MPDDLRLPPGQQLAARDRWPLVGEPTPPNLPEHWTVEVDGLVERPKSYTLAELRALPCRERLIDIHCVTRWSKPAVRFAGTPLVDLLSDCGVKDSATFVRFESYSPRAHDTSLPLSSAL